MAGRIAVFRQTVKVPLYDWGYSLAAVNGFTGRSNVILDPNSTDAFYPIADAFTWPSTINRMGSDLISVGGLSRAEITPTSAAANTGVPSYIDGIFGAINAGPPPAPNATAAFFFNKQNPAPGVYDIHPLSSYFFSTAGLVVVGGPMPLIMSGRTVIAATYTSSTAAYHIAKLYPSFQFMPGDLGQSFLTIGQGGINTRWNNQPALSPDNVLFFNPGASHGTKSILIYRSLDLLVAGSSGAYIDPVSFDNAAIQAAWGTAFAVSPTQSGNNAFITTVYTNGAGPTGNPSEILRISPDWSWYDIIQPIAQDVTSAAALLSNTGYQWQAKIDSNGIFWFNPGDVPNRNKMFMSYSPNPPIPTPYFGNLQPFPLPCMDFCNPLTYH